MNELNMVLEASNKAEPEDVDDGSPIETAEEELDLDVKLVDGFYQENNSEIVVNESPKVDKVKQDNRFHHSVAIKYKMAAKLVGKDDLVDRRKIVSASNSDMRNAVTSLGQERQFRGWNGCS